MSNLHSLSKWLKEISIPTYVFVMCFAISSWIDINGAWVEVPLLVNELPESWNLPSYLVILIQVANIGPLTYTIAKKVAPNKVTEWPVIYVIITVGIVSCILLGFFWDYTTIIAGTPHSTALLVLCGFLAIVDCTSSVVHLPYMAQFRAQYLTAFYIGEGLSGLIPALIGIGQGIGRDPDCVNQSIVENYNQTDYQVIPVYAEPLFSVSTFFFILSGLLCLSLLSFTALHLHPHCRRQRIDAEFDGSLISSSSTLASDDDRRCFPKLSRRNQVADDRTENGGSDAPTGKKALPEADVSEQQQRPTLVNALCDRSLLLLLLLVGWTNALTNGTLPSLQSYSSIPYGNSVYNLSVRLSVIINPVACFVALFVCIESAAALTCIVVAGTVLSGYQIALAALSPNPPLVGTDAGSALAVVTFVLLTALFSYFKVCAAARIAKESGPTGLLWCGCSTQIGSLIGAVVTFLLVNTFELFTGKYPCT